MQLELCELQRIQLVWRRGREDPASYSLLHAQTHGNATQVPQIVDLLQLQRTPAWWRYRQFLN